ncbi:hypothetical protein RJ639_027102 [Escallonia herrerae]|uniref:Cytochrome P450 n=1 Tax=Escallonia herrerae TaxID=1293975 RepID=A0AA88X5J6_9ASTE|nr:hypothetical protein RJ639_027102 [Escallonia herrerae]
MGTMRTSIVFLCGTLFLYLLFIFIKLLHKVWWTPIQIQQAMRLQGIKGPSYRFLYGSTKEILKMRKESNGKPLELSHYIFPKIQPHLHSWINIYEYDSGNVSSVEMMLERWKQQEGKELEVFKEFRTAFGSSNLEGHDIFHMLTKLSMIIFRNAFKVRILGLRRNPYCTSKESTYLRSTWNIKCFTEETPKREKAMNGKVDSFGNDFLGLLVKANHDADEGNQITVDDVMNIIINELLRLYPPVVLLPRIVKHEAKLGKFNIPVNTTLVFPTLSIHHDTQIWGEDAQLFKPERFSEGVAKATNNNPAVFLPFGLGPRSCVGLNFAWA